LLIDNVKTGDRVEITPMSMKNEETSYMSIVEAVLNRQIVLVHAPTHGGAIIRLSSEINYFLQFMSGKGFFKFRARVNELLTIDGFKIVQFYLLDKGERTQRRDFFRFDCAIPTKFVAVDNEGMDQDPVMMDGLIHDLSGGGMKMMSANEVKEKAFIRVMLQLNDEYIMIFGEVLHKKYNRDSVLPFQYGVKFAAMSKADQEKIIQFLYMEQRKALQRAR
jgi:c-di-GMP-binding flagellar brake protein YcgR